jgi:excisionase family DNA binding protein
MDADWLTVGEAARYLGVSEPTLRKWTDEGRIEVFRTPGKHRRYLLETLIRFRDGRENAAARTRAQAESNRSNR